MNLYIFRGTKEAALEEADRRKRMEERMDRHRDKCIVKTANGESAFFPGKCHE